MGGAGYSLLKKNARPLPEASGHVITRLHDRIFPITVGTKRGMNDLVASILGPLGNCKQDASPENKKALRRGSKKRAHHHIEEKGQDFIYTAVCPCSCMCYKRPAKNERLFLYFSRHGNSGRSRNLARYSHYAWGGRSWLHI